jgi:hypothetical protein
MMRIFATKAALTSKDRRYQGRSEVILDQAILGLLIKLAAAMPWGIKELRLIAGAIRRSTDRFGA